MSVTFNTALLKWLSLTLLIVLLVVEPEVSVLKGHMALFTIKENAF